MIRRISRYLLPAAVVAVLLAALVPGIVKPVLARQAPTIVQGTTPAITLVAISATAAVNTQTTLTIPAPAGGLYNYVCTLAYQIGNDNTGAAISNAVSTSTNFNAFAVKVSKINAASNDSGVLMVLQGQGTAGCAKSTAPGTATTFVSPAGLTHDMWTWYATYFQGP